MYVDILFVCMSAGDFKRKGDFVTINNRVGGWGLYMVQIKGRKGMANLFLEEKKVKTKRFGLGKTNPNQLTSLTYYYHD